MRWSGIARTFHVYRRALQEVRAYWAVLALILVLGLVWIPVSLLLPLPLKILVDNVLGDHPLAGLAAWIVPGSLAGDAGSLTAVAIGLSIMLAFFGAAHRLGDWLLRESVADRMVHGYRGKLLLHGMRMPDLQHAAGGVLDLGYRINQDAPALQWTAVYGLIPVVISLSTLASTLYVTAAISTKLALLAIVTAVPMIGLMHGWQGRLKAKWHTAKEEESLAQGVVHEVLGALRVVTLFGQERRETARFLDQSGRAVAARHRALRIEGLLAALLTLSTALGTAAILYLGVRDVQAHVLSVGDLLMVMTYIAQLYAPLQAIGTHIMGQQHAMASAERAFAVLDRPLGITDCPGAKPRAHAVGDVRLEGVAFAYEGRAPVLRSVDLDVPAGTCVALVGRTGAGKTTVVNLLTRMFDPDTGAVLLDDVDLRDWRLDDLRRQFAVVPQEPILFSTTIGENIAYGRPEATPAEIATAARLARVHDFIAALPEGYATKVGERGFRLSGGERQRIALARAFLKDAPLLILDEPTSALDQQTESAILETLERLMQGRTTFLVTHRPALLRLADMRLRIEDGSVLVEQDRTASELRKVS
jgi:ATP-binding cassette subfamily B protein